MNIINLKRHKLLMLLAGMVFLGSLLAYSQSATADPLDLQMSGAANGSVVQTSNSDSTVLGTFSPDLDLASSLEASMTANATSSATAYYGVDITSATTTGDVHWKIVVSHSAGDLADGDVTITEKGYYDADNGKVEDSSYASTVVGNTLVFTGNSGWEVANGDTFTDVDSISFSADAPIGTYTIIRSLVDSTTGETIGEDFTFTVELSASADVDAPLPPVITSPVGPHSTTTNPITLSGTAEASSTISVTGGSSTSTAATSVAGNWSTSVNLNASSTNMLSVTATDAAGNVSSPATISITHSLAVGVTASTTATTTPVITLNGDVNARVFACNGFVEPGFSAVGSNGVVVSATSTGSVGTEPGTYIITYTAMDASGHIATTTRSVTVVACSAGSGGGGGSSRVSTTVNPSQIVINGSAQGSVTPGQVVGQVLGATTFFVFNINLTVGARGQDVIELQTRLMALGYFKGPITGYFGPLTKAAVTAFQRDHGLPATGFFGPMTRAVLNS